MNMMRSLVLLAGCALLVACTGGQAAQEPPFTSVNLSANTLTFAVGTAVDARQAGANVFGLNTVVAYRQPSGLSAVLSDTPTITGPAGFVVPAGGQSLYPLAVSRGPVRFTRLPAPDDAEHAASSIVNRTS